MSSGGIAIRSAERGDVAAVLALWAAGRSAHASQADTAEAIERLLADGRGALLVAERDA